MSRRAPRLALFALSIAVLGLAAAAQEQEPTWPREPENASAPKPAPPPRDWTLLIGEYESPARSARKPVHLYVIERDGKLMTIAGRGAAVAVDTMSPKPVFARDAARRATAVTIGGVVYRRLQVGPEGGSGQLRVTPVRPVADVLRESQALSPPAETGTFLRSDFVELATLEPSIRLDIRYATTNNFLGSVFYAQARAFLQRPAAEAVARVHKTLAPRGYGILVHDGYRPWYVTKTFWECTPADRKWLVANPEEGSRHNRGAAVDLTLYDLKTGAVIEMPSTYDESTPRAYAFYPGGTSLQRWHRALLRRLMEAEGFAVNPEEWWHFDYKDWKSYPIGNVAFDRISGH
jgi:D-alanyl-D-alanine dipeptidase